MSSVALLAIAWWTVWRFGARDWFSDSGLARQILMAGLIIVWGGIPVAAAVQLVAAMFSQRVFRFVTGHKLIHVMWFILAGAITITLLAPVVFRGATKG